jgi:hypothetical protein
MQNIDANFVPEKDYMWDVKHYNDLSVIGVDIPESTKDDLKGKKLKELLMKNKNLGVIFFRATLTPN